MQVHAKRVPYRYYIIFPLASSARAQNTAVSYKAHRHRLVNHPPKPTRHTRHSHQSTQGPIHWASRAAPLTPTPSYTYLESKADMSTPPARPSSAPQPQGFRLDWPVY